MMKVIIGAIFVLMTCVSGALAAWPPDFSADEFIQIAEQKGAEEAVVEALKNGVNPADILSITSLSGEVEPEWLVRALYCSGVLGDTVAAAAESVGMAESTLVAGYRMSTEGCGPAETKTFNALPDQIPGDTSGRPPVDLSGAVPVDPPVEPGGGVVPVIPPSASPSTF